MTVRLLRLAALIASVSLVVGCGGPPPSPEAAPPSRSTPAAAVSRYVALGDSYTAAPGVPRQVGPALCARSDRDYPALAAAKLKVDTFVDRSCSGADTSDMAQSQAAGVPPQFAALTPATELVTVGIGGNDLSLFGAVLGYCVQLGKSHPRGSPCTAALRSRPGAVHTALHSIGQHIVRVLRGVQTRSPRATVLAVGYPQLVPAQGTCSGLPLARGDYRLARQINKGLDDAVRAAAQTARVRFVDPWTVTAHHDICAQDPWINGATAEPGRAIPFHPFEAEQQAVARLVVRAARRAERSPAPSSSPS